MVRKNNITFLRGQVINLKNKGLGSKRTLQVINIVNGSADQISYNVSVFLNLSFSKNIKQLFVYS